MMRLTSKWPRGSEWRKWDLHLHSPSTKLNDQFKTTDGTDVWDAYCRKLHESDVQAFGITDYFSADGYFSTIKNYSDRFPGSPKVFFPNVELRTNDVVNKKQEEVNIHLLFNSFQRDHEAKIKAFLNTLKTNKTDESNREMRASELQSEIDYSSATTTRIFIRTALEETFGKDADLLDHVLIITAANNDGIRPERGKHRKEAITDELDKFSNAFFGGVQNVNYFLKTDRAEGNVPTEPKPVLSGCDAHSFLDLDEKLGRVVLRPFFGHSPTWIKADLTYEGLKQIVFEPENRVYIGELPEIEKRVRENPTRYIESLHITCVEGYRSDLHGSWFNNETIELGKELVAIIGNKGNGKSAIADIIGLLGNSRNQSSKNLSGQKAEELFSFLNEDKFLKGGCAKHFHGVLKWYEGEPDRKSLNEKVAVTSIEKVEYLPQKYLERICTNIADDEFRSTLNMVIFRYVKPQDRHGKLNLDELIQYLTHTTKTEIFRKQQDLQVANEKVASLEEKLTERYREELLEKIRNKNEEIDAHIKCKPQEIPNPEGVEGILSLESAELEELDQALAKLEKEILSLKAERVEISSSVESLRQVRQSIENEVIELKGFEEKFKDVLGASGLTFDQIVILKADYTALENVVNKKRLRLGQIEVLLSSDENSPAKNSQISQIEQEVASIESLVSKKNAFEREKTALIERLGKPEQEYQQYLNELKLWTERERELRGDEQNLGPETLNWLEKELASLHQDYPESLKLARDERGQTSREIFQKKRSLTQFYNEVKQSIDDEIAECRADLAGYDITIEAGLHFNSSFMDEFLKFVHLGAAGSFHGQDDGRAMLGKLTDTVENWEDEEQVFAVLNQIVDALHRDKRESYPEGPIRDVFKQMKGQKSPKFLYDYLFSFDYLEPKYDLKVDGKDLSELSPGERGGLLLIFYLMLDRQEIPLIIDQPEDNLDNKSVYEILVKFIKRAKKRRQIIFVTHNPNLAVVADAEQIIHVSIDKRNGKHDFDFFSGSIEFPLINQTVVDILEGTLKAFDNRRMKYRKPVHR